MSEAASAQFDREKEQMVLDAVERFLEREVRPVAHQLEHDDTWPTEIVESMKEMGLFGCIIREEYGGLGLSASTYAKIVERISRVWMSVSGIINSHLIMAACVQRNGTEEQRRRYLPRFASGELRGGLALTEPDCGTDLQAVRTVARRDGDFYVVNGTKTWISNGIHGSAFAVLVKTDTKAEPRHRGMSLFICEKGPGFAPSRKLEKLGYKGIDSAELVFDDFRVPAANLVGGVEGQGFKHVMNGLEIGRINVAARGVGIARACLEESVAYAQVRKTFGKPICEHQAIQIKLAEMATGLEAAIHFVYYAAWLRDNDKPHHKQAAMAKLLASETAARVCDQAARVFASYGYAMEYPAQRFLRDVRFTLIGGGTSEILKLIIAKEISG